MGACRFLSNQDWEFAGAGATLGWESPAGPSPQLWMSQGIPEDGHPASPPWGRVVSMGQAVFSPKAGMCGSTRHSLKPDLC